MSNATAPINGTNIGIYIDDTLVLLAKNVSLNLNHSLRDVTTKDSAGWKENLEGLRDWSADVDGLVSFDSAYNYSELFALVTGRTKVTVKISSEDTGDKAYAGEAFITSLSQEAGVEETASYSASFEGTGALAESTIA